MMSSQVLEGEKVDCEVVGLLRTSQYITTTSRRIADSESCWLLPQYNKSVNPATDVTKNMMLKATANMCRGVCTSRQGDVRKMRSCHTSDNNFQAAEGVSRWNDHSSRRSRVWFVWMSTELLLFLWLFSISANAKVTRCQVRVDWGEVRGNGEGLC